MNDIENESPKPIENNNSSNTNPLPQPLSPEFDMEKTIDNQNTQKIIPPPVPEDISSINQELPTINESSVTVENQIQDSFENDKTETKPKEYHEEDTQEVITTPLKTPKKVLTESPVSELPESFAINNTSNVNESTIINEEPPFDDNNLTFDSHNESTEQNNGVSFNLDEMMNDLEMLGVTSSPTRLKNEKDERADSLDLDDLEKELSNI